MATGLREEAIIGQAPLSEVCAAFQLQVAPGTPMPKLGPKAPLLPSLSRSPGGIWTPGNRGRLAQVRVEEAMELVTTTGSAFQSDYE